ncbi:hypothetical protein AKO1_008008 [Acrasis kona]|uniref:C1q domain-containing protein n=1 Tax=Acrasis kona TaxID=1008807 RepID=A0AAW2YQG8_9EUKA
MESMMNKSKVLEGTSSPSVKSKLTCICVGNTIYTTLKNKELRRFQKEVKSQNMDVKCLEETSAKRPKSFETGMFKLRSIMIRDDVDGRIVLQSFTGSATIDKGYPISVSVPSVGSEYNLTIGHQYVVDVVLQGYMQSGCVFVYRGIEKGGHLLTINADNYTTQPEEQQYTKQSDWLVVL